MNKARPARPDRPLPHSLESERAFLGALLLGASVEQIESLQPTDFYLRHHRVIFQHMKTLVEQGRPIDPVLLYESLAGTKEIEDAGGLVYISQLGDGLPRISNLGEYSEAIKTKAAIRQRLYRAQDIVDKLETANGNAAQVLRDVAALAVPLTEESSQRSRLIAVSAADLIARKIEPTEMILAPILSTKGLAMIYSSRGVGKTWFALGLAYAAATGGRFLKWTAPKSRRVLFVDGELPATTLQSRLNDIIGSSDSAGVESPKETLRFVTPDFQNTPMPDVSTIEGQVAIEGLLRDTDLVILDNLSCLSRSGKENEAESWVPVQEWILRLRQRGKTVVFVHHSGKGGEQRGTSRREDVLDLVIALRKPSNYSPTEGARYEVHFEKGRSLMGDAAKPFEVRLERDRGGSMVWTMRELDDVLSVRAAELHADGLTVREIAVELGIPPSTAHRLIKRGEGSSF